MSNSYWQTVRSGALVLFGVLLPLAALAVELVTRMCAGALFDPLRTVYHTLLVAFVALANGWACLVIRNEKRAQVRWAIWANGIAMGVALFYSVLFLPLLPLGTVGILYFGFGFLVWAPLASFIVALRLRVHLRRCVGEGARLRSWPAVVLGFLALIALDLPATVTRIGARMAIGDTVETRARGIRTLRMFGSDEVLLRMCYVRTGSSTDMLSLLTNAAHPVDPQSARQLYYRMTGRAFNSVPAPVAVGRDRWSLFDWDEVDFDQGVDEVGGRTRDLWLASSRLDGSVSADAALGYLEWTMVFRNASQMPREARAQIALPPGAVVSRVTLWINGEEREAAFAGRGDVKAAYQAVVRQNRDPVLVTTAGPDRISMQLFPVPASGEMKVRVGMTVPLELASAREGILHLPYFHERNFEVRKDLRHGVWIAAKSKLHSALSSGDTSSDTFRADIEDARLLSPDAVVMAARNPQDAAWSADMRSPDHMVRQVISEGVAPVRPRNLVVVIDGSAAMQEFASDLAKNLASIPAEVSLRLIFAQDGDELAAERQTLTAAEAAKTIASFDYAGGNDNTGALVRALDLAFDQPDSALLWIHGPQPVLVDTEEALLQRLSRGGKLSKWYELQVAPGRNLVTEKLDGLARVETLRSGDVRRMVSAWRSGGVRLAVQRDRVEGVASTLPENERTSDHLVRLWANDEITRLIYGGGNHRAAAIELAQRYQLVTPVSGAVVLETRQQYDAAGLQPVPEGTVPTIPEPEEWILIIVALLALGYAYRRRHAFAAAAVA